MSVKSFAGRLWARYRIPQLLRKAADFPAEQTRLRQHLLTRAKDTAFGREHGFDKIRSQQDFRSALPVRSYEDFKPYIDRASEGEAGVLWPGHPLYFATTSGTTAGAKYIPISRDSMPHHITAARDALMAYIHATGKGGFLDGKMIFLAGSPELDATEGGIPIGRLSGIVNHFVPSYLQRNRMPSYETNCIDDWETKVARIVEETKDADMRLISGIPPWVQMYFERLREVTGKRPIEQWPNLQLFVHGGVDYRPYDEMFRRELGGSVDILEVYPASEGFLAFQNDPADEGLLLLPDNGMFYEFIPLSEYGQPDAPRLTIGEVETGVHYALVISTDAGLWAYDLGDTVRFTSLNPPKVRVSGRVKHFLSAFGEHVIQEEVNNAMLRTLEEFSAQVNEFSVAPFVSPELSYHEWFVEFSTPPEDDERFAERLDMHLQAQNPYYKDLREGNMLARAALRPIEFGASRAYMKQIGKLGGQNKFPRLANDRRVADVLNHYRLDNSETPS